MVAPYHTDESDTDKVPPEQTAAGHLRFINLDLKFYTLAETAESQQEKRTLDMLSQQTDGNPEEVKLLMKLNFYKQGKSVNQGKNIHLLEECLFWFDELGKAFHFNEFTRTGLKEKIGFLQLN